MFGSMGLIRDCRDRRKSIQQYGRGLKAKQPTPPSAQPTALACSPRTIQQKSFHNAATKSLFIVLALFVVQACSWTSIPDIQNRRRPALVRRLLSTEPTGSGAETEDPCWQDIYDDDCSMSSVYSASFVAGKWVKTMPCASNLDEDCDMEDLDIPGIRQEGGVDHMDVMGFLGLKKAENLSATKDSEGKAAP